MTNTDVTEGFKAFEAICERQISQTLYINRIIIDGGLNLWKGFLSYALGKF